MSETRRRKIYAGYYDRYDRKPFYVVCEAADYDTGEVNIIMQEYSLVSTKPFVTISRDSFCEFVTLPNGRKVDKFTRNANIPVSDYYSEYKEFFDERFRKKKSIRKYAADHNLNRGSVNYMQKKFYNAFAEQLDARDKAENVCRIQKQTEKKKTE